MKRAYSMKYRHLTFIKGIPHYQRRFPTDLVSSGLAPSANYKQSLKSPVDKPSEIIREIDQCNERFERFLKLLRARNLEAESKAEIDQLALTFLENNNLSPSDIANAPDPITAQEAIEARGIFNDILDISSEAQYKRVDPQYNSDFLLAQKRAYELLKETSYTKTATLNMVKSYWIKHKNLSQENKSHRRDIATWDNFISINGGDALLTEEVMEEYLHKFTITRSKQIKSSSLQRQITTVMSAVKLYCRNHRIKLNIELPHIEKDQTTKRSPSLLYEEQKLLLEQLKHDKPWKELYCLIGLHTGWHAKEAVQSIDSDLIFNSKVPRIYVSSESKESRKNKARGRTVPLVFRVERIKELVASGALAEIQQKTADNAGAQITKLLKRINPHATMYSMRHTLAHNIESAGERESLKANLGGWSGKEILLSEHMATYGKDSADSIERLLPLQTAMRNVLEHLRTD
jgi:hypothetical protein